MKTKPTRWWRRARKTDHPIWHFMANCPSLKWSEGGDLIVTTARPRTGSKCDHCQNLHKKS